MCWSCEIVFEGRKFGLELSEAWIRGGRSVGFNDLGRATWDFRATLTCITNDARLNDYRRNRYRPSSFASLPIYISDSVSNEASGFCVS